MREANARGRVRSEVRAIYEERQTPEAEFELLRDQLLTAVPAVAYTGFAHFSEFLPNNNQLIISHSTLQYGMGSEVSTCGDVYSFGILLLEMFTGRRPTDETFKDGLNLHTFAATSALGGNASEIVIDPIVLPNRQHNDNNNNSRRPSNYRSIEEKQKVLTEAVVSIIQVGIECSKEAPRERMSIQDVATKLITAREKLLQAGT